jgi:hypothetical protein
MTGLRRFLWLWLIPAAWLEAGGYRQRLAERCYSEREALGC